MASLTLLTLLVLVLVPMFTQTAVWSSDSEDSLVTSYSLPVVIADIEDHKTEILTGIPATVGEVVTLTNDDLSMLPDYPVDIELELTFDAEIQQFRTKVQLLGDHTSEGAPTGTDLLNTTYIYLDPVGEDS